MANLIATILLILTGVSLIWVAILTIKGRPIERRFVFIYIAVAVALPLFMKLSPPLPVTTDVKQLYDALEHLQPGSKVLVAFDYDPPSAPELQPMAVAFMKYAFKHDLRVIIMGLWPQGPQMANEAIEEAMADPGIAERKLQYGRDWVNLGFQSGNEFVIQSMGTTFKRMFPTDENRIPYDSIPLLNGVTNFSNIDFVFNLSSGKPGTIEWVQIAVDRFGVKLGAGNTAVQAPQVYPYLGGGQLTGLLGGMSGAAEFEKIVREKGQASTFLLSQTFAHAIVILFVIIGNMAYFRSGRKQQIQGS
jgi:hypothetical protein